MQQLVAAYFASASQLWTYNGCLDDALVHIHEKRIEACYVGARGLAGISRPSLCRPHTTKQHIYDWPKKLYSNVIAFARAIKTISQEAAAQQATR